MALATPVAVSIVGLLAWLTAASVLAVRVARNGAVGWPSPTILVEVAVVLVAAACVGAAVGSLITNRAAGPAAALLVYGSFVVGPRLGVGSVFTAGGAMDGLAGLRVNPAWWAGFVGLHLAIGVAGAVVVLAATSVHHGHRVILVCVASGALVCGALAYQAGNQHDKYVSGDARTVCVGEGPTVCGPRGAEPAMTISQRALAAAYDTFGESGLPLRARYAMARGYTGRQFPASTGDALVDPSTFERGSASRSEVLQTMVMPSLCADYFGDEPPEPLMDAQLTVMDWLDNHLGGPRPAPPAPTEVQQAYDLLLNCEPLREPVP